MRYNMNFGLGAVTLAVLASWMLDLAANCSDLLFPQLRAEAEQIDRWRVEREAFVVHLEGAAKEVAAGQTTLRDACRKVEAFAASHYPMFLSHVRALDDQRPLWVGIAKVLRCYCDEATAGPTRFAELRNAR